MNAENQQLMTLVHSILIRHPRFEALLKLMNDVRIASRYAAEPQCLPIEGATGVGKSTLAETMVKLHPRFDSSDGYTKIPVLSVLTPSPATPLSLVDAILQELKSPDAGGGNLLSREFKVSTLFRNCGVELLILDDFQHLVDSETQYVLNRVSEWLKAFIKRTKTPVVVIGMPKKVTRVIRSNQQLSRLFLATQELTGFGWDESSSEGMADFSTFVGLVEKQTAFPLCPDMPRIELLRRIHYATNGTVGNTMNLLRLAITNADARHLKTVDLLAFDEAFALRLEDHMQIFTSPFRIDARNVFTPPIPTAADDPNESVGKRGNKRRVAVAE